MAIRADPGIKKHLSGKVNTQLILQGALELGCPFSIVLN